MLTLVAQAEPAIPPSSSKMNSWLSTALMTATRPVVITAMRGREMPLKNPSTAQSATPSGAPSMRGCQNAMACSETSGARPKGANNSGPDQASKAKKGSVSALAVSATHVAWLARMRRRPPSACATNVCTARPTPPTSIRNSSTTQYTAAIPAIAVVEMWPTNHVSVRLITACRLLFSIRGSASIATAR